MDCQTVALPTARLGGLRDKKALLWLAFSLIYLDKFNVNDVTA